MSESGYNPAPASLFYRSCQVLCRLITTVFFDLKVSGKENLPKTGGILLLSNHQSYLDPVIIGVQLRRPLSFLGKAQLFHQPALSWLLRHLNGLPLHQGAGDIHALRETIKLLKAGHILTMFPEGSRTCDGELHRLQPGFALVVRKADVPIVPVAVEGSYDAWPKGTKLFRPYPIRVKFGPPLDVHGLKPEEILNLLDRTLRGLIEDLRRENHDGHTRRTD